MGSGTRHHAGAMKPELIRSRALALGGVLSTHVLRELGLSNKGVEHLVASGLLHRVRPGAFVLTDVLASADRSERYRLKVAAVVLGRSGPRGRRPADRWVRASHHAGLAVHGVPLHGVDLGSFDLVADVRHGSTQGQVTVRPVPVGDEAARIKGVLVCELSTCLIQTAAASGVEAGVVALDGALGQKLVTLEAVRARAKAMSPRFGGRAVSLMLEQADPRCESPGESLTRLILGSLGMDFESQAEIRAPGFFARVDFLVGKVVVEFDGAVKYEGASGRGELVKEKKREDELRRLGYEVVRLTWADLSDPARVGRLIREAQQRAARASVRG